MAESIGALREQASAGNVGVITPTDGAVAELLNPTHRQGSDTGVNDIHNYYYGPVHHIGTVANAAIGPNHGTIIQNGNQTPQPTASSSAQLNLTGVGALLNPIYEASHTRNRRIAPPDSACLPGTRKQVLKQIRSWVDGSLLLSKPHVMWVYGYAGCGKSAVAQCIAEYFAQKGRLAASFFFFRQSGDRNSVARLATTLASQVAAAVPGTVPIIESAVRANPGLATPACSLAAQFQQLIYDPIEGSKWDKMGAALRHGGYLIVLDGLDECGDREEVAILIQHMLQFFHKKPRFPIKFLITSRVEQHIHQQLRSSKQVQLLNLVDHTSDADISAALDARVEIAKHTRVLSCTGTWPSPQDKGTLIRHIGGSFIFMTTIAKYLFDLSSEDGLTPITRLPLALKMNPGFDGLYSSILAGSANLPHFYDIVAAIALAFRPLSIAELSSLLAIDVVDVVVVLTNLHAIMQVPDDDHTPVTLWHTSLYDFLTTEGRSGSFFANPTRHDRLTSGCIPLALHPNSVSDSEAPAVSYAKQYIWKHCMESLHTPGIAGGVIMPKALFSHGLACEDDCISDIPDEVLDGIYMSIFTSFQSTPHFLDITRIIVLAQGRLSIAELADLSGISILDTVTVLRNLQGIVDVPASDISPLALWHLSIREFLGSETRSGPFFASMMHHRQLAYRCISLIVLAATSTPPSTSPALPYSRHGAVYHWREYMYRFFFRSGIEPPADEVDGCFAHLRSICPAVHDVTVATYANIEHVHDFFDTIYEKDRMLCSTLGVILHHLLPNKKDLADLIPGLLEEAIYANRKFDRPLLAHSKRLFPHLLDPSHHLNMVMCGVVLLVQLKDSDDALVLHSRSDYPTSAACEYMFAYWARHLALAIEGNPQHPAFNTTQPTRILITTRLTVVNHYELPVGLVERVGLNLGFAQKTVRDLVGPEALSTGNEWEWDLGYGPRAYIKKGADSVTVFEVLNGIRGLFSCYRSTCSHIMTRKCPFLP